MAEATTPRGEVIHGADEVRVEYRREFALPVSDIWAALTEPERLERWIGTWTGEPGVGKSVDFLMLEEGQTEPEPVTIIECDPPRRLVLDWNVPAQATWRVEATLTGDGESTSLHFVQRMSEPEGLRDVGPGWQFYLDRLTASLTGAEMPDWSQYYPALADAYGASTPG
jgi:uncharacterized protein YndB with AHSA1/START domain